MNEIKEIKRKKLYKILSLSASGVLIVVLCLVFFTARVSAKIYYNEQATPRAIIYEGDIEGFLPPTTIPDYEEINVNYKISYDSGEEQTGTRIYFHYVWSGGDLSYVKITTDATGNNIFEYWERPTGGSMGRLFFNGSKITISSYGKLQDYILFLSVDTESIRQNKLFYFFFFEDVYYKNGYDDGYDYGYDDGYDDGEDYGFERGEIWGKNEILESPNDYDLYTAQQLREAELEGQAEGIADVKRFPNEYGLFSEADLERAKAEARQETEADLTGFVGGILGAIQGFFNIQLGSVKLGAIILIPFSISIVWFIIKQFRGGGD